MHIIYLTREPKARVHLAADKLVYYKKVAPYFTRARALLFASDVNNKSYNGAKHNHKLNQIRICNHSTSPFLSSGG